MRKGIRENLISRDYYLHILQDGIPKALFCPPINVVGTTEKLDLYGTDLRLNVLILLGAKRDSWSQEPNELQKPISLEVTTEWRFTWFGGMRSSSCCILITALDNHEKSARTQNTAKQLV